MSLQLFQEDNNMDNELNELDVNLDEIHLIFEKINPPETEIEQALKLYDLEHIEYNGLIFGAGLGLCDYHCSFSIDEKRNENTDCLLLLKFNDCCNKLDVVNVEKKQLRAFWFWNNKEEASWLLTAASSSEFSVNFECATNLIKEVKFNPTDLLNISSEIQPQSRNMQKETFVFRQTFGWTSFLTISPLEQQITFVVEKDEKKIPLLKLGCCHQIRVYDERTKILEIFAGSDSVPNIRCFIRFTKNPYVWIEIGYSKDRSSKPSFLS